MCAIAGIIGLPFDSQILDTVLGTMQHRGPAGNGSFMEQYCCLLHTRSAGIALPITLEWAGKSYVITSNAEIFNANELRDELLKFGHTFSDDSDAMLILHAYAQWGEKCVEKINGIFAFAIWEKQKKKLFVARDRIGVKPFFYTLFSGGMLFASEIKTLLAYPGVPRQLDHEGVAQILLLGPGRMPGSGVLKNVFELMPGCCGYYSTAGWNWWQYWKLHDREHKETFEETAECVRYLVTDAITRQIVTDEPFGTFLSGGLDSSLVSTVCASNTAEPLHTFSLDYVDNDKYFVPGKFQPNSDNSFIDIMQKELCSVHSWTVLSPEDLVGELENAVIARDLPGMADVDSSLLAFCRQIRQKASVVMSGECADEIFGGYPWFRDPEVCAYDGFPWSQNRLQREKFIHPDFLHKISPLEFVNEQYLKTIRDCDILPETPVQEKRMKQMVNLNQQWFMQTLLDRNDRMSAACDLRVRVPFCDYRIVEYLYGVPWEYKNYRNVEKGLLRYAMDGVLPDKILWRKKSPFPKTHDPKYLQQVRRLLRNLLDRVDAPIYGIVSADALTQLLNMEFDRPWYGQLMQQPQTIAYMLQINFWLEHYKIQIV